MNHAVLINGTKDSSGNALVTLDGGGSVANAFVVDAAGVTIKNLAIGHFSGAGVVLEGGGGDALVGNYIGLDSTGTMANANFGAGVSILSGNNTLTGNVISGNFGDGVDVTGDGNKLFGNFIGTDVSGLVAIGNGDSGVAVDHATNTVIGGVTADLRNLISGNGLDGVTYTNDTGMGNVLQGNLIGTDVTGMSPLGNGVDGVDLGTSDGLVVSNLTILNNVLSGNFGDGSFIKNGTSNTIQGTGSGRTRRGMPGSSIRTNSNLFSRTRAMASGCWLARRAT